MDKFNTHLRALVAEYECVLQSLTQVVRENGEMRAMMKDVHQHADRPLVPLSEMSGYPSSCPQPVSHVVDTAGIVNTNGGSSRNTNGGTNIRNTWQSLTSDVDPKRGSAWGSAKGSVFGTQNTRSSEFHSQHVVKPLWAQALPLEHFQDIHDQFVRMDRHNAGYITAEECAECFRNTGTKAVHPDVTELAETFRSLHEVIPRSLDGDGVDITSACSAFSVSALSNGGASPIVLTFETFLYAMDKNQTYEGSPLEDGHGLELILRLRKAFHQEANHNRILVERSKKRTQIIQQDKVLLDDDVGCLDWQTYNLPVLVSDVVPALVIMGNALVIAMSADIAPGSQVWELIEIGFAVFYSGEFVVKIRLHGCRDYFVGKSWMWNLFDLFCLLLAFVEFGITYGTRAMQGDSSDGVADLMLLKMLRLTRLGRLIRLVRFKFFHELQQMIQGVFSGIRVLFWAVVLLFFCVFVLGVVMRKIIIEEPEFNSVPAAMFTVFRCFTDGCDSYDGKPLTERLRIRHGSFFMVAYMLVFLFVTIGIFNLIMATFVDNVVTNHVKRNQVAIGNNATKIKHRLTLAMFDLCRNRSLTTHRRASALVEMAKAKIQEYTEEGATTRQMTLAEQTCAIIQMMEDEEVVITREVFNWWLEEKDMENLFCDADIETSTRFDLFDALDADLSGELTFSEVIEGLMRLRGPISKSDLIAIRLKVRHVVVSLEEMKLTGGAQTRPFTDSAGIFKLPSLGDLIMATSTTLQLADTAVLTKEDERWI